jgi:hypothetical protein
MAFDASDDVTDDGPASHAVISDDLYKRSKEGGSGSSGGGGGFFKGGGSWSSWSFRRVVAGRGRLRYYKSEYERAPQGAFEVRVPVQHSKAQTTFGMTR